MEKKILVLLTLILVALLLIFFFIPVPQKNKNIKNTTSRATSTLSYSKNLKLFNLNPDQKIYSPLVVMGEAKGWYFEGSFPSWIEDQDGNIISMSTAQARSDWMTEEFVPFETRLEFKPPITEKGFVVFQADNPSGKDNPDTVKIPVSFKQYLKEVREVKTY